MKKTWWPKPLLHIAGENPWIEKYVVVAETKSFDDKPHAGQRSTFSALVPMDQLEEVKKNLQRIDTQVSASGPRPSPSRGSSYDPKFWIGAEGLPSRAYEPFVLYWHSHDKSILLPDPRFLMTYGLSPRSTEEASISWDDPTKPVYDVVLVKSPSIWSFPFGTTANVLVLRDYLQDYLTLRNCALVQTFWESRFGRTDREMEEQLGEKEAVEVGFDDRRFQLNRYMGDRTVVVAQVWGGRVIAVPGSLPVSDDSLEKEGLIWPGFEKPVTRDMAIRMNLGDVAYVDDAVLNDFEGKTGFRIHPETGSVTFGTQWGVGFCDRVGRNLIRLELKKLYEGIPTHITRHWNKFAVEPIPDRAYPAVREERNIAVRAKEITFGMATLGEGLAALAQAVGLNLSPEDFVSVRRGALEYSGWWTFEDTEVIARQVPLNCSGDMFLGRCMSLNKLIVEGLSERALRGLVGSLGVPSEVTSAFGSLKLLDCIVRMVQKANATGLLLVQDGKKIWERLATEGTVPPQPIAHFFALYDIRLLQAHKAQDRQSRLSEELSRFGVKSGENMAGYGLVLDSVYDVLNNELAEAGTKISAAL